MNKYKRMQEQYIKEYGVPLCACGCGQPVNFKRGKPNKFILHHSSRIYDSNNRSIAAVIGSRKRAEKKGYHTKTEQYIKEHGIPLCACGCGQPVNIYNGKPAKYIKNHKYINKYKKMQEQYIKEHGIPLCACGCGQPVNFYKGKPYKYLKGHNGYLNKPLPKPECACGCGQLVAHRRNKYVKGHQPPAELTDDIRYKRSKAAKINWDKNRNHLLDSMAKFRYKPRRFSGQRSVLHDAFEHIIIDRTPFRPEYRLYCHKCQLQMQFDYILGDNVLVQLHGHYWHSMDHKKEYDDKIRRCICEHHKRFELFEIWEYDFLSPNRLSNMVDEILGKTVNSIEVSKSKLKVIEVDWKEADKFLFGQHYLGCMRRSATCYGLMYMGELVGVACYASATRKSISDRLNISFDDIRELIRFYISPKIKSKNLASWFLSRTSRHIDKCIIAFSDPTFGHIGTIYKACGWKYNGDSEPSYGYIDRYGNTYHKLTVYKHASRMKITEKQLVEELSLVKIKTLPKKRYILDNRPSI